MGDTSLIQLRDAIDVIIGKLDEKIEASQRFSIRSKSSLNGGSSKRQLKRCKERAFSNNFEPRDRQNNNGPLPREFLLQQLGLRATNTEECRKEGSKGSRERSSIVVNDQNEKKGGKDDDFGRLTDKLRDSVETPKVDLSNPLLTNPNESKNAIAFGNFEIRSSHEESCKPKKVFVRHKVGKTNSPL